MFRIAPLSEAYAAKIRASKTDNFGHTVTEQLATGLGPCRVSLQPFLPGQDVRLLFSHSPFENYNAFNQPGPIFIHKKPVAAYADIHCFPPAIKEDRINFPLILIGYSAEQQMVYTKMVGDNDVNILINEIFKSYVGIAYLHARNAEACCYICRIERL